MIGNGQNSPAPGVQRLPPPLPQHAPRRSGHTSLRDVMSQFATGITVLTVGGDRCHGMTANAFSSVSLEPPLVLCCVSRVAAMHEAIASAGFFAVSMLSAEQEDVARYFADRRRPPGLAQFDRVEWLRGPRTGAPLLAGSLAWLECELTESYQGGDHSIFLGTVVSAGLGSGGQALLFFDGDYQVVSDAQ